MNSSSETTESINGGVQANATGNLLESFVENLLTKKAYTEFPNHRDQIFANRNTVGGRQYAKQVPCGMSIYETQRKCDFLIINSDKFPDGLIVECKWQQTAGSVDEKYPFTVLNVLKIGVPTVILLDGGGYKPMAMKWLKDQVGMNRSLIGVWNMKEFQIQVNNGFLG